MKSSKAIFSTEYPGRSVRFWEHESGVAVESYEGHILAGVVVKPAELAEALNEIPGFTVKYVKPIAVPQYLGAVVERQDRRWMRVRRAEESSYGWIVTDAPNISANDDDMAAILTNGGHEVEPEFPTRTP